MAAASLDLVAKAGTGVSTNQPLLRGVAAHSDGSFTTNDDPATADVNEDTHKRFYVILSCPRTTP